MNKTSTLRGIMLDTYRTRPLTNRRLRALCFVRGGAMIVPMAGLCPYVNRSLSPELVEGSKGRVLRPMSFIN